MRWRVREGVEAERPRKRRTTKSLRSATMQRIAERLREGFGCDEIDGQGGPQRESRSQATPNEALGSRLERRVSLAVIRAKAGIRSLGGGRAPLPGHPQPGAPRLDPRSASAGMTARELRFRPESLVSPWKVYVRWERS